MSRVTNVILMELVHVKIEKKVKDRLEHLVRRGIYKNKSEAVRRMLEEHLMKHPELFTGEELKELLKMAHKMSDEEFRERLAEGLKGAKSVAQMLAEERDRFA